MTTHFQSRWHALAFIAALALCLHGVYWEWLGAPLRAGGTLLVIKVIPLAACLIGLWRGKLYVLQIVSMLVLLLRSQISKSNSQLFSFEQSQYKQKKGEYI